MEFRSVRRGLFAILAALPMAATTASAYELTIPTLDYRTGPYAPNGIPFANGFTDYMNLLKGAHSDGNLDSVMCRSLISVDWQGYLYDCDFNQMLGMPLDPAPSAGQAHLRDWLERDFNGRGIRVAEHCYGCTAGQGSSCGGALV